MALIAASAVRTCLGDGPATFARLLAGEDGLGPLRHIPGHSVNVKHGYHIPSPDGSEPRSRATAWLGECVAAVLAAAAPAPRGRIPLLVGTGLRELREVERWAQQGLPIEPAALHFAAVRGALPQIGPVITISNACSASGHALALAQDLVEQGAPMVIAAGADAMTASMLAMIGRVGEAATERIRPFDAQRTGVLLGEGAAAVAVVPDRWRGPVAGRLLATGMSGDAFHETAPSLEGVCRAMGDALARAARAPYEIGLVVCHGTGTPLNDATEALALRRMLRDGGGNPLLTAVKGALGHTSGASSLMSVDVALRCLASGSVPPIAGLREPLAEADGLRLVRAAEVRHEARIAQVNSFGFGGVNAVTLVGTP